MPQPTKLETYHETLFTEEITNDGAMCIKWGINGYPDRVIYMDCNTHFFIEFKREGKAPRKLQKHRHDELRKLGHEVYTCDSYEEAITIYNRYKAKCQSKKRNKTKKVRSAVHKPHDKKSKRGTISSTKPR